MIPSLIIVTKEIILNLKKAESGSEKTNLFLMNMMKQWTGCLSARLLLTSLRREDHVCGQYTFIYSWWGWRYVRKYSGLCVTIYPTTRGEYGMQQWNTTYIISAYPLNKRPERGNNNHKKYTYMKKNIYCCKHPPLFICIWGKIWKKHEDLCAPTVSIM